MSDLKASVRWADGSFDSNRECVECGLTTCVNPVYNDYYRTISSAKAKAFDAQSGYEVKVD